MSAKKTLAPNDQSAGDAVGRVEDTPQGGVAERGQSGRRWKLLSATAQGSSHSARGQANEDALRTALCVDGTLVMAVADGAGSARLAGEGARLAVAAAVESVQEGVLPPTEVAARPLESAAAATGPAPAGEAEVQATQREAAEELLFAALRHARRRVAARARELRVRPRDFASTLLVVVIRDDVLSALQLGDGAIVASEEGRWERLTQPLRGDHAGETVFVTSRGAAALARLTVRSAAGVDAVALLTDGLEPVATDVASGIPHAPFFEPLARFGRSDRPRDQLEAELSAFLASDRLRSRTSDDLTLALALRE